MFCFFTDLMVVTWLYFNHFEYNKHNYHTNNSDDIQRFICLSFSLLVCLAITLRYKTCIKYNNLKFLLSLIPNIPQQKICYYKLFIEIICHIIQPYPKLSFNFERYVLGVKVNYSLDMIFFCLSIMRFYVILKIIKTYNPYTNSRGHKLNEFFGNKNQWMFLYRTNLKNSGFLTVSVIFIIVILADSYIFKVFENYQKDEKSNEFGNFFNCLWLLVQSISTIGFGDLVPYTIVGRIITGIVCMSGIFLQSLFTVSMLMFIFFIDENEQKAYAEINLLFKKEEKSNNYKIYFNQYIKNKFSTLLRNTKKKDLMQELKIKNDLKILKEKYFLRILASMKIPLSLSEFSEFVKFQWEPQAEDTIEWYKERIDVFHDFIDFIVENIQQYQNDVFFCLNSNTKMVNLVSFMFLCGTIFPIKNYNELKGRYVVSIKEFEKRRKQFNLLFQDNNFDGDDDRCLINVPEGPQSDSISDFDDYFYDERSINSD